MPMRMAEMVDRIRELKLVEVQELVKVLEEELGVSATATVVRPDPQPPDPDRTNPGDPRVTVGITEVGPRRLEVIRALRATLGLGLREARDALTVLPAVLATDVSTEEAERLTKAFAETGATVEPLPPTPDA